MAFASEGRLRQSDVWDEYYSRLHGRVQIMMTQAAAIEFRCQRNTSHPQG